MQKSPPIKGTINKVKSLLLRPALTSHYECYFNPPGQVSGWIRSNKEYNYSPELFTFSCVEASLPGSSLMTNEINDDFTGVTERLAYRRQYDDRSDFTFYVDYGQPGGNYNILWFFENWIAYIAGEDSLSGRITENYSYRVNYPINYRCNELCIDKFERDFKGEVLRYQFIGAYPISIASMPLSYESSQILKCTVSFTYLRYVVSRGTNNTAASTPLGKSSGTVSDIPSPQQPSQPTADGVLIGSFNAPLGPGNPLRNAANIVNPEGTSNILGGV